MRQLALLILGASALFGADVTWDSEVDPGSSEFGDIHRVVGGSSFEWIEVGTEIKEGNPNWADEIRGVLDDEDEYIRLTKAEWDKYNRGRNDILKSIRSISIERDADGHLVTIECIAIRNGDSFQYYAGFQFKGRECTDVAIVF